MKKLSVALFFMILVIAGCNTAQKALDRGDYERSAEMTIQKLRSKPGDKKARRVFEQAWPMLVDWHLEQISSFRRSSDPLRWASIADSYETLERLGNEVRRCPACLDLTTRPPSYREEIRENNLRAAEAHYDEGIRLMRQPTRVNAREASEHFRQADARAPGFKDAQRRLAEALEAATLKVLVEHLPVNLRRYELSNAYFRDQVLRFLENDNGLNPYVRFYTPDQLYESEFDEMDQIMFLEFVDFSVGNISRDSQTQDLVGKDTIKIGETRGPGGVMIPVYGLPKARFTSFKKTVESGGELEMRIVDNHTGRLLETERFGGTFVWTESWATFNGQKEALSDAQLRLTQRRESRPPPDQDLFVEFTKPVYDRLTERIRRYYRNY